MIGMVVPIYKNFPGFAELMQTVDHPVYPVIIDNWNINRGVARAWNLGLEVCLSRGISQALVVNDDILFREGTIDKLISDLESMTFTSALNDRDFVPTETREYEEQPEFSCFAVNVNDFVQTVGFFDEKIYPAYFEDNDMHYRMKLAGTPALRRKDAPVFHRGSVTQNWDGGMVVSSPQFEKNRLYYRTKWGGVPGEEKYTTPYGSPELTLKDW